MRSKNQYTSNAKPAKKKSTARLLIILFLLAATTVLAVFSVSQYLAIQALQDNLDSLEEKFEEVEQKKTRLEEQYEEIYEENEKLREENKMMRSETIINYGNRETNKVAITIDDGAGEELTHRVLDIFKEYDMQATLFPKGNIVENQPEVWRRAVEEGHELGNHTYSHPFITKLSEEQVREELTAWQDSVDEAIGSSYRNLFFRPPYGDGFLSNNSQQRDKIQQIVAEKGMFTILWDIELIYALGDHYTKERVVEHVLANAKGGSIVLLHFNNQDIAALPDIITGLRERDLEPCSLSELLLAEPQTEAQ